MRRWLLAMALMACSANLLVVACGSSDSSAPAVLADNDGGVPTVESPSDEAQAGPAPEAGAPVAMLRVAHLSPDLPALDVCVAAHGVTDYQGPLIARLSGVEAGAPGISFAQVSAYLAVEPGRYDVRLVPAGSGTCATSPMSDSGADAEAGDADDAGPAGLDPASVHDFVNLPLLAVDTYASLLVAGDLSPTGMDRGLTAVVLFDDAALAGGGASLRAVNAVPSVAALDFGLGSLATRWTPLLTNVAFGAAGAQAGRAKA